MANNNAPFGFRQHSGSGSAPTFEQVTVRADYNASAIYYGDPVTAQADGTVAQAASTGATPAALGIAGIFVGCRYLSVAQKRPIWSNYWPGSDVASGNFVDCYIINDQNSTFVAQSDATGLALVDINATVGFVIGTGNAANGLSGAYVDSTTLNTATYNVDAPFRVVGIVQDPPTSPGTLGNGQGYDWVILAFNNVNTRNFTGA